MLDGDCGDVETFKAEERYRNFEDPEGEKILGECSSHAYKYKKPVEAKGAVILIHPFHFEFHHREEFISNSEFIHDADRYLENISRLLEAPRERSKMGLVVFEHPEDYAKRTKDLLEKGVIDSVVFTRRIGGIPIYDSYGGVCGFSSFFFGGLYDGLCLSQSIDWLKMVVHNEKVHAIRELVLESPKVKKKESSSTLVPTEIREVDPSRVIGLEEILHKFI